MTRALQNKNKLLLETIFIDYDTGVLYVLPSLFLSLFFFKDKSLTV